MPFTDTNALRSDEVRVTKATNSLVSLERGGGEETTREPPQS